MTTLAIPVSGSSAPEPPPGLPIRLDRRHWLAALAVLFVFITPYQTLVQTVITDDAVRKGLDIDPYDMTWQQVGYGVGVLYGTFVGLWLSARIGTATPLSWACLGSLWATCCVEWRPGWRVLSWAGSLTVLAR